MRLLELLLGRPLRSDEEAVERIGVLTAIPVLGLDALASASYGPEAALTVLLPLGATATIWVRPITLAIVAVLTVVALSYAQTIPAYPNGGGSFTVAKENLHGGEGEPGSHARAAGGRRALHRLRAQRGGGDLGGDRGHLLGGAAPAPLYASALPGRPGAAHDRQPPRRSRVGARLPAPHLSVRRLAALHLRARRLEGGARARPSHARRAAAPAPAGGRRREPVAPPAGIRQRCTALNGVEAVSNAVPIFREPKVHRARRTLAAITAILMVLLLGISLLSQAYGIGAT